MCNCVVWLTIAVAFADSVLSINHHSSNEDDSDEDTNDNLYNFLYKRMQEDASTVKRKLPPNVYTIPGPQEPLPGRTHSGDYWPVFPFHNQYSGGLDLDPSISRHIGGDLNLAVPSWGMLDIYGRFFNRISDTTSKWGFMNHPVNMMDLEKEDFVQLMSNPSTQWNRAAQPTLPLGKLAKQYVPLSCKPPLCNPYHANFGLGIEHDWGGSDGVEGDIDVPIPLSKGVAYRFPFAGKVYYDYDNMTITYGQNLAPIDPFASLFDYQKLRDPNIAIARDLPPNTQNARRRRRRAVELINNKSNSQPVHAQGISTRQIDIIASPVPERPYQPEVFIPIGKDKTKEDADFKPTPINPADNDKFLPISKDIGKDDFVETLMKALDPNNLLSSSTQEDREKILKNILLNPELPTPSLKVEQDPTLEKLLQEQLQKNAFYEGLIQGRIRELTGKLFPTPITPITPPITPLLGT